MEKIKLWNPNAAANLSLLLTPIFGTYIHAKNWETLGDKSNARKSRIWMYASIAFLIIVIFLPTGFGCVPSIFFLVIWYLISGKKQIKYVREKNIDYMKKTWIKPVSISTFLLLILIILALTNSNVEDLYGTWKPDIKATLEMQIKKTNKTLTPDEKQYAIAMAEEQLQGMQLSFSDKNLFINVPLLIPASSVPYKVIKDEDIILLELKTGLMELQFLDYNTILVKFPNEKNKFVFIRE